MPSDMSTDKTQGMTASPRVALAELEDWLSTSQTARTLGLSQQRILQMAEAGQLGYVVTTVHGRLFDPAAVESMARSRES